MKSYGFKNICNVDVYDYINLNENPMYLKIHKKDKKFHYGISLRDFPTEGHIKVNSIQEIEYELRKNLFVYENKYTDRILKHIQCQLYP